MKIKTTEVDKSHEHNDKQENPEIKEYCEKKKKRILWADSYSYKFKKYAKLIGTR